MQSLAGKSDWLPRRLAGAALYALLVTALAMPLAVGIAGLIMGPPELRAAIVITPAQFGAVYGSAGLYAVFAATVAILTLGNAVIGPRRRYAWDWNLGPALMDDAVPARDKLALVLRSGWGRVLLALDAMWLVLAVLR